MDVPVVLWQKFFIFEHGYVVEKDFHKIYMNINGFSRVHNALSKKTIRKPSKSRVISLLNEIIWTGFQKWNKEYRPLV